MAKQKDLTGRHFGKLTAISIVPKENSNKTYWLCRCDCGNEKVVLERYLLEGSVLSCGCLRAENLRKKIMVDITGQKFGKLTAIKPLNKNGRVYWECKCDCGNVVEVYGTSLRTGHTSSCGCITRNCNSESKTHLYMHYGLMKARCSPKFHYRKSYYDNGIKVCDEWLGKNGFLNFKKWALSNGYQDGLTLDRIDNDGNYEPSNCRWTTVKEQANNRSTNRIYEFNGMKMTLTQWSEYLGISRRTLEYRQQRGIKPPELFDVPNVKKIS